MLLQMSGRWKKDGEDWDIYAKRTLTEMRKKFTEAGHVLIQDRVPECIWQMAQTVTRAPSSQASRNMLPLALRHAGEEWRCLRSATQRAMDPWNKMCLKRRRAGGMQRQ